MNSPGSRWYHSVGFVLLSLFVALGPFALPLLWKSPRFSERAKWFLTALTLVYTGVLLVLASLMFQQLLDQVRQLGGL